MDGSVSLARDDRQTRAVEAADMPALKAVIASTQLFPPDLLDGMVQAYLDAPASTGEFWLTNTGATPVCLAYCAPERMTAGTWNILLMATHASHQGRGWGRALVAAVVERLANRSAHLLLVETSGLPDFARTRGFYKRVGFEEEARIRDFYQAGEDKVVFRRSLPSASAS